MSILPDFKLINISLFSLIVLNLFKYSIEIGKSFSLFVNVLKCWNDKIVVGTNTATCLLLSTALKAALIAISVLPKPTSPQISLSIG